MLNAVDGAVWPQIRFRSLQRIEDELDLADSQIELWRAFVDVFDEIRNAIDATEAISELRSRDFPPSLDDSLDIQARLLIVRLNATRRLQSAAMVLMREMTPRQRAFAEKRLAALRCGPLGSSAAKE